MPVSGLGDLKRLNEQFIQDSDELRTIVMLNCGAVVNLNQILRLPRSITCLVLDSHRPIHLANVYQQDSRIIVFNDGSLLENDLPSEGSDLDLDPYSQSEEDSDISDLEDNDENDGSGNKRKRNDKDKSDRKGPRKMKRQRREALANYYSGDTTVTQGFPAASLAYLLAQQANLDTNDLLWYAIVGMTQHSVRNNMTREAYESLVSDYVQEVHTKNAEKGSSLTVDDGTVVKAAEHGRIVFDESEYRFMLHRHWSLYDSMFYSDYFATKLGIWTAAGKAKLEDCLAKIGIPLSACKQKFSFMSAKLKKRLRNHLPSVATNFGLDEPFVRSFHRHSLKGYGSPISAADAVYCVSALLDASTIGHSSSHRGVGGDEGSAAASTMGARDGSKNETGNRNENDTMVGGGEDNEDGDVAMHWILNFNAAYDALGGGSEVLLEKGLALSMHLQRSVVQLGTAVIEKKMLRTAGPFRYTLLTQLTESDTELFTRPGPLARLAQFVASAKRETDRRWRGRQSRPYIICCADEKRNRFLIVGVIGNSAQNSSADGGLSAIDASYGVRLGRAFELAGKEVNGSLEGVQQKMQEVYGFDKAVATVGKKDIQAFLSVLIEILSGVH
eukprot:g861.t1